MLLFAMMAQGSFVKRQDDPRALAAERTALVASGSAHLLQAGLADIQDTANVSTGVSQSAHQGIMQRHSVAAIIGRSASRRALQTDRHRQRILQLRRTYNLELCLLLSSTVTLSLYLNLR